LDLRGPTSKETGRVGEGKREGRGGEVGRRGGAGHP